MPIRSFGILRLVSYSPGLAPLLIQVAEQLPFASSAQVESIPPLSAVKLTIVPAGGKLPNASLARTVMVTSTPSTLYEAGLNSLAEILKRSWRGKPVVTAIGCELVLILVVPSVAKVVALITKLVRVVPLFIIVLTKPAASVLLSDFAKETPPLALCSANSTLLSVIGLPLISTT